jgi:hypothetical protein
MLVCTVKAVKLFSILWDNYRTTCFCYTVVMVMLLRDSVSYDLHYRKFILYRLKWKPADIQPVHVLMMFFFTQKGSHPRVPSTLVSQAHPLILQKAYLHIQPPTRKTTHVIHKDVFYHKNVKQLHSQE